VRGSKDTLERWRSPDGPIRVGVSSCLLGREVRFDGGHKRDAFLHDELGRFVEWVPVCPEVEVGMGIPRPMIRIVMPAGGVDETDQRLVETASGRDHTRAMQRYAKRRVRELDAESLCGYVLKKDSPSCGMERVRVHGETGMPRRDGRGFFARALLDRNPLLPVEEEGRLHDPGLRELFVERLFAYQRLRTLYAGRFGAGDLVAFHTAHKMQLMAHSETHYRKMGRLVANTRGRVDRALRDAYATAFMQAFAYLATRRRHCNVLQHMLGHLRGRLDDPSRHELLGVIEDYRAELVPLVVPITLFRHHVRRLGIEYLDGQLYLEPHPKELMLRNRV
jgi:uncharacterized protein YbgA (DUF1722 family)/uncharacterized protein YbbK (DUF523 family)